MVAQDNRLRATMGLMARDNDNEAIVALRQATRMLADRGLDWGSLADIAIRAATAPRSDARPNKTSQSNATTPKQDTGRTAVIGYAIPKQVMGTVMVIGIAPTKSGGMKTIFAVDGGDMVYGPIVAYTRGRALLLQRAAANGARVAVDMLTRGEGRHISTSEFRHHNMRWRNITFMPQAGQITWLS